MIPTDEMVRVADEVACQKSGTFAEFCGRKERHEMLEAALTAALAAMWQPIENADPDTPYFCFWKPLRDNVVTADNYGVAINAHGNWHNPDDRDDDYSEPSFYMPLPPAPTQLSTRGAEKTAQSEHSPSTREG